MSIRWALAAVLLMLTASGSAQAAPSPATPEQEQQARRSFERAEGHFRAGQFAEALVAYQEGYDLAALPGFLINIAQCQRRLGELAQARTSYRKFVMVAPDSKFVPEVKKLIAELDDLLSDESKVASSAKGQKVSLEAGPSEVSVLPSLTDQQALATATAVENPGLSLTSVPSPAASTPKTGTRWWLWGTVGAVTLTAATVAVLALRDPGTNTLDSGSLGTLRR